MTPAPASPAPPPALLENALLAGHPDFGELVFVRHGQQAANNLNDPLRQKDGDAPLSELGTIQAHAAALELERESIDAMYTSDLARARSTAQLIADPHGIEPVIDPDCARSASTATSRRGGRCWTRSGPTAWPRLYRRFEVERSWDAFRLTEPRDAKRSVSNEAMEAILDAHPPTSRVVIVCHGGVINVIVRRVIGVDADMIFFPAHGSISRIGRGPGRLGIVSLNERAHLAHALGVHITY